MRVDRAADMTCSKMNHFFDLPATAKREGGGRWPAKPGPVEGEELGAVFDAQRCVGIVLQRCIECERHGGAVVRVAAAQEFIEGGRRHGLREKQFARAG